MLKRVTANGPLLAGTAIAALALAACPAWAQEGVDVPAPPVNPAEALAPVHPASAGEAAVEFPLSDAPRVFVPADFAAFSPRSALDMVKQLPGFTIESGSRGGGGGGGGNGSRGLGQASGNVLVNGERLTTKSDSVDDQLARIPADAVMRIELVEGSTLNIPGLSGRVANVVAQTGGDTSVQFEWRPQMAANYADYRWLEGVVSLTGEVAGLGYTLSLEGRPVRNGNAGPNIITYGSGRVEERFSETNMHGDDKRVAGTLHYRTAGGTVLNANGSFLSRRFHSFDNETVVGPVGAAPLLDLFNQRNRGHDRELGGDIDFALGGGRMKLIGLDTSGILDLRTEAVIDPATGVDPTGSRYRSVSTKGERIGRGEYSWSMWGADWQWSVEGAFNRLDQVGELYSLRPGGVFAPLPFPSGTGGVREERFESLLSYSQPLAEGLSLQLIVGGEYSSISQTGADANARTFQRPKGSLTLAWAPASNLDLSLRIDRRVGQLNFSDFLAAVNLSDNNQNASNNNLRPDQSWGGELEVTRDFGAWGSGTVRLFGRRFSDYVTIVPTRTGGEARGNVNFAQIYGGEVHATLQFAPLGVPGAKLDLAAAMRRSRFPDPVQLGQFRRVQMAQPANFEANLRYDIPTTDFAIGGSYRYQRVSPYTRVAEFGREQFFDHTLGFFLEDKDVFGLSVQARVNNLLNRPLTLERSVFTGPRGTGGLLFQEDRRRYVGRVFSFIVKGSF